MRVLLVQPPMVLYKTDIPQFDHPHGLAYIAAFLRNYDFEVSILDSIILDPVGHKEDEWVHIGLDWDSIKTKISAYEPNVVGISSMFTSQAGCMHKLAKLVKDIDQGIVTIVGGAHPSSLPGEVLVDKNVDYVVLGEGEITMLQLIQHFEGSFRLEEIDGVGYRENGQISLKPRNNLIQDLDSLPFPAYELLEMDRYAKFKASHGPIIKNTPFFSISTSRGCPMNCVFCGVQSIWGRRWRARSAENVVNEIEILRKNYGIKEIYFLDDALLVDKKRMEEICDDIVKRKLDISWAAPNGVNINSVDYDLLRKMKESNCFSLCFGIESGNQNIRDKIVRKHIRVQHAKEVIRWCRELNIWTNAFFILGLPGEDEKTFLDTIRFSRELDTDSASFFISRLIPGTELYKLCEEKGYIEKHNLDTKSKAMLRVIRTETFSPQDLERWRQKAYRAYTLHVLKREVLHFNLLKRVLKIRSLSDFRLLFRIASGAYERFIGRG